ncbi:hypothetical protein LB456_05410 [Psychroflexus sp. CAK57W]|uniref:hypothetical protein n=1 Tax=Psychroflexus curvus TaxID=2873595 RepID=UPI001CCAE86D|nr:hypothetical protein [Psychroflexus curvus]MBZ9786890.1 hypothetical protein [Psychroflexus curvus]
MINKKNLGSVINLAIVFVVGINVAYFITVEKILFNEGNQGIKIVLIASLAALVLCRFSLLKAISRGNN